jgi:MFS family permease
MVTGYGIIVLARYLLAFFSSFRFPVIFARLSERIGNGIQAAPRSALVGDISPPKRIGASYGLKRSLATIGSFSGAAIAMLIMWLTNENYRVLFAFTTIPATIGFILLIFFVKEPKTLRQAAVFAGVPSHAPKYKPTFKLSNFKLLGPTFWKLMTVNFIFLLARMGETFLSLYGRELGLSLSRIPIVMMVFNLAWSLSSYPVGQIADRMNRYWLLCLGMVTLVLSDLVISNASALPMFFLGVALWGIQYGTTQNIFLSLINEAVPETLRGTGLGIFWLTSACATMIGDSTMGYIAHRWESARYAFIASGIVSILGLTSLLVIMGYKIRPKKKNKH